MTENLKEFHKWLYKNMESVNKMLSPLGCKVEHLYWCPVLKKDGNFFFFNSEIDVEKFKKNTESFDKLSAYLNKIEVCENYIP